MKNPKLKVVGLTGKYKIIIAVIVTIGTAIRVVYSIHESRFSVSISSISNSPITETVTTQVNNYGPVLNVISTVTVDTTTTIKEEMQDYQLIIPIDRKTITTEVVHLIQRDIIYRMRYVNGVFRKDTVRLNTDSTLLPKL